MGGRLAGTGGVGQTWHNEVKGRQLGIKLVSQHESNVCCEVNCFLKVINK